MLVARFDIQGLWFVLEITGNDNVAVLRCEIYHDWLFAILAKVIKPTP